jgi:ornithine cyclodeaminase
MKILDADQAAAALPFERLIPALRDAFVNGAEAPLRHRHDLAQPDGTTAALLLMPAWRAGGFVGVKVVSVFPGNGARSLPAVSASYLLCDGATGQHLALIDGAEITRRRTAAASALAGSFLARDDAASLLIVGPGTSPA